MGLGEIRTSYQQLFHHFRFDTAIVLCIIDIDLFTLSRGEQSLILTIKDLLTKQWWYSTKIIMAGLENRSEGKFITILQGKFCIRAKEGDQGAIQRTNKLGKVVWEKFYDRFTGKLTSIKVSDGTYGKSWNFGFKVGDESYTLQLSYSNSFATAFLKMLPNIDLTKDITLSPSVKKEGDKVKSSLFVNQDGVAIKHAYTKEIPNGLPPMEEVVVKGQKQWDDTKRIEFLHAMVVKDIIPKLGQSSTEAPKGEAEKSDFPEADEINANATTDEGPF